MRPSSRKVPASPRVREAERAYAFAVEALEDESKASRLLVQALQSLPADSPEDRILIQVADYVQSQLGDNRARGQVPSSVPEQVAAPETARYPGPPELSPVEWQALWHAVLGLPSDNSVLAQAIAALDTAAIALPISEEDIP